MIVFYTDCYARQAFATHLTFEAAVAHARELDASVGIQTLNVGPNVPGAEPKWRDYICALHYVDDAQAEPRKVDIF